MRSFTTSLYVAVSFVLVRSILSFSFAESPADKLLLEGKRLYWSGGNDQAVQAEKKIKQAISLDPSNAEAHYFLGYLLNRVDNPGFHIPEFTWEKTELASREFEKALQLQPQYKGEIISLPPREKIMSEWSALALANLNSGNIPLAKKAFGEAERRGGIVPQLYTFMKNMLLSCPEDAVLITGGPPETAEKTHRYLGL